MDPICRSPYRLAALRKCRTKSLTEDRTQSRAQTVQKTLASRTATTEAIGHGGRVVHLAVWCDGKPLTPGAAMTIFFAGFALSISLILAIGAQNAFVLRQGLRGQHVLAVVLALQLTPTPPATLAPPAGRHRRGADECITHPVVS